MINDTQRDDSSFAIRFSARLDEPFGSQLHNAIHANNTTISRKNNLTGSYNNEHYIYIYITNLTDLKKEKKRKNQILPSQCNGISRRFSTFNFFFLFQFKFRGLIYLKRATIDEHRPD